MTVSREEVILAYRLLLGRPPESDAVVDMHMRAPSSATMVATFLRSAEFLNGHPHIAVGRLPWNLPQLTIDTEATDAELTQCIQVMRDSWTLLGASRPYFSVLTSPHYLPENLAGSIQDFWQSGLDEARDLRFAAERHGMVDLSNSTVVEFGCGVGRVTMGLAQLCRQVHAYDISAPHLTHARLRADITGTSNVTFHNCATNPLAALQPCDLFYSALVFQHNPPVVIGRLIRNALGSLRPGGLAVFQVPTYEVGYRFRLSEWLQSRHPSDMQMHCFPQHRIFEIAGQEHCELLEVLEDGRAGPELTRISNLFVFRSVREPP